MGSAKVFPSRMQLKDPTEAMQSEKLFETELGVCPPWYVKEARFDGAAKVFTIDVDFKL